jgi:hypothetical protein
MATKCESYHQLGRDVEARLDRNGIAVAFMAQGRTTPVGFGIALAYHSPIIRLRVIHWLTSMGTASLDRGFVGESHVRLQGCQQDGSYFINKTVFAKLSRWPWRRSTYIYNGARAPQRRRSETYIGLCNRSPKPLLRVNDSDARRGSAGYLCTYMYCKL